MLTVIDSFRDSIGKSAGTDIMNQQNRTVSTHRATSVYDLLGATLNLWVAALHRCKIEILARAATGQR